MPQREILPIVDYPASPRPSLVDSMTLTMRAASKGEIPISPTDTRALMEQWEIWGEQIIAFAPHSGEFGVDYLKIQPGQPMIDCKPGSNRYSFFDDYKTNDYLNEIMGEFAPDVAIPEYVTAENFLSGRTLDLPVVFKDVSANGGINKFLIETEDQLRKLRLFLVNRRRTESLDDLALETFIDTPTEKPTSYRYTMTPTGTIIAASLLYHQQL